jgi:hypothetical protein
MGTSVKTNAGDHDFHGNQETIISEEVEEIQKQARREFEK